MPMVYVGEGNSLAIEFDGLGWLSAESVSSGLIRASYERLLELWCCLLPAPKNSDLLELLSKRADSARSDLAAVLAEASDAVLQSLPERVARACASTNHHPIQVFRRLVREFEVVWREDPAIVDLLSKAPLEGWSREQTLEFREWLKEPLSAYSSPR